MSQLSPAQLLRTAVQYHQAGELPQAEALYRQILAQVPNHPDALHLLGVIAYQAGRHDVAIDLIGRAIAIAPNNAPFHANLAEAYRSLGRFDEALAAFRRALDLQRDYPDALYNLGRTLQALGRFAEAADSFQALLRLNPHDTDALLTLGNALKDLGRRDEAVTAYRQALTLRPDFHEAASNLGSLLHEMGQLDQAIACFRQALAINPRHPEAHNNLGNVFKDLDQFDEAIACYRQALALKPDYAQAASNLGNVLKKKGLFEEAVLCYHRALQIQSDYAEAHTNLGNALKDMGRISDAIASYRRALALKPLPSTHSGLVYAALYDPAFDAPAIYREHQQWNQLHATPLTSDIMPHPNDRSPNRRLRIGYVSPDFRRHCQAFFTIPLLAAHDHQNFEIFCYADVPHPDEETTRLQRHADTWRSTVGLSDLQIADLVRRDRIDILVDLTMHMEKGRLLVFARKPAPVQVTWLAYPGTTGLTAIDYRLTDPYLDPPSPPPGLFDAYYSEQSIRLPDTFWCYVPLTTEPPVSPLPALVHAREKDGQEKGEVTFGCLNNPCKLNDDVFRLWARVLRGVPHSRLIVLIVAAAQRQHLRDLWQQENLHPDRIEFVPYQPPAQYLGTYHRIDIGLDTFPYNGHTTSLDSYWMGVPVITLVGQTVVGRAGLSQLTNLGLPELIARTPEEFVQIASDLAQDLPRLAQLRATLRDRMLASPLMDAPRFARAIESAYRTMWQRYCNPKS